MVEGEQGRGSSASVAPEIVAMSDKPGYLSTLGYAQCWEIKPVLSDLKSRGPRISFCLDDTQIRYPDRLSRLVLVMALAIYWAVSTRLWDKARRPLPTGAKPQRRPPRKLARSLVSLFTRGLRRIACLMQQAAPLPALSRKHSSALSYPHGRRLVARPTNAAMAIGKNSHKLPPRRPAIAPKRSRSAFSLMNPCASTWSYAPSSSSNVTCRSE